jgi:hypothetical protein
MTKRDLPASHYPRIYRIKLATADDGATHPSTEGVTFIRQLVQNLSTLDPDTPVTLDASGSEVVFRNALTGSPLGHVQLRDV